MEWKKTFNKGQWLVHATFLLSSLVAAGAMVYALRLHHLQSTEEERITKLGALIAELNQDKSFDQIGKFLSWAEADNAHDVIRSLSGRIAKVEEILEIRASEGLNMAVKEFNDLIGQSAALSDPDDALKLLRQKVASLNEVARGNGYRNLTIISERMKSRLEQLNGKNVGESNLVGLLRGDLRRMEQLTAGSTLPDHEKSSLASRFTSMAHDLELLGSIYARAKDFRGHVSGANEALEAWVKTISKRAEDMQGLKIEKQKRLVLILASLVSIMVLGWLGVAYVSRWQKIRISEQVEREVKHVIEKGVINDQRFMVDHYSEVMRNDIIRLLDDLKVKLSLGSMLHEGLPFPGCLIDKNFRLTWHNQLFLEQLGVSEEEVRSEAFNWDFIRDYLNLSEDPIYQAFTEKISGIFPVKIKQDELTPALPYEMYVTPVTANREEGVMVFFYSLVSVKDAISEQVDLAKAPLERFIQLWEEERLSEDELRLLGRDFANNDLQDLHQSLLLLHERVEAEKSECYSSIRALEKENLALSELLQRINSKFDEKQEIVKQEFKLARELQQSFIASLEKSESLVQLNRTIMQHNDELRSEAQRILGISVGYQKQHREISEIISQLEGVRVDYKKLKQELSEVKSKLVSLNSSLLGQLPPLEDQQQRLASRYKDELARLDFNVCTLDKKLTQLDVLLGKLGMMHSQDAFPGEQTSITFLTSQKDHELRELLGETQRALSVEEGKIVDHFKGLHQLMRKDLEVVQQTRSMGDGQLERFLS